MQTRYTINNAYPFGAIMPGRSYNANSYRYAYNGMLKDDEVFNGSGNSYTTYFRQHDTRLGRWFSVDPEFQPWQSPYTSMDNNPIMFTDPLGDSPVGQFFSNMFKGGFSKAKHNLGLKNNLGSAVSMSGGLRLLGAVLNTSTASVFNANTMGPPNGGDDRKKQQEQYRQQVRQQREIKAQAKSNSQTTSNTSNNNSNLSSINEANAGGGSYVAGEGNISPDQFRDIYSGKTESQIMRGESSFLGYKYPNRMADKSTRFVMLANGKEVDMIHFMVVGRAGHVLGFANEVQQAFQFSKSAFNPQDLYSNQLGVNFFRAYGTQINQNPTQISNYIYQYFNNPNVLYPPPFQPQWPTGPKY